MTELRRPNIFSHAQKELSQDAMISYLLEWAAAKYRALDASLSDTGRRLVQALLAKHGAALPEEVETVDLRRQAYRIDVLARINGSHTLLIEDKTGGKQHSNQLQRYYNAVRREKAQDADLIFPIFLKTWNYSQQDRASVENTELDATSRRYRFFDRRDLLEVLSGYEGRDRVTTDYRAYLQEREDRTQSYHAWQRRDRKNWHWLSWEGFYSHLQQHLRGCNWSYVPNQSGGFLGLWWNGFSLPTDDLPPGDGYLQLEVKPDDPSSQHLCFKVAAGWAGRQAQVQLRPAWHQRLMEVGGDQIRRPRRFGLGNHMTLAIWNGDWLSFRPDGLIDLDATVHCLRQAESLWDAAAQGTR